MIDTSKIIHVPNSVKVIVTLMLTAMLGASIYFIFFYVDLKTEPDWVILALSIAQISATGLILFILLIFSERYLNEKKLRAISNTYIREMLPRAIEEHNAKGLPMIIERVENDGPLMNYYHIKAGEARMTLGFLYNLKRFSVYMYLSKEAGNFANLATVKEHFAHGFEVAESVGYHASVAETDEPYLGKRCYALTFMQENLPDDFLSKPHDKLFFAQDIAQMVSWYMSQEIAGDLDLL